MVDGQNGGPEEKVKNIRMEGDTNLSKEDFEVLPAEILLRYIPHLLQHVACCYTRLCIHASK